MVKSIKIIGNVLTMIAIVLLLMIAATVTLSALSIPGGIKLYTVQSGSMEPAVKTGSVVIVKPAANYKVGDVITFKAEADRANPQPKATTTHRIYSIKQTENGMIYQTKGDANDAPDVTLTASDLIVGKVFLAIPWVGYPVNFARTQVGLIILIIIPAVIIIYSELLTIKNEIARMIRKRQDITVS